MAKKRTYEEWLAQVKEDPVNLNDVPNKLLTEELCLAAVQKEGAMLGWIPESFKTGEICLTAIKQKLSEKDCGDKEIVVLLGKTPVHLRTPEMCRITVEKTGGCLQFVPEDLRTLEICLLAFQSESYIGNELSYVPEKLRTSEICIAAVKNSADNFEFVPESLKEQVKKAAGIK